MEHQERIAYLEALVYMATIDEKIEDHELDYFNNVGVMYGISTEEIDRIKQSVLKREKTPKEILGSFTDRKTKLSLIYELLALCYSDNSYSVIEKNGLTQICNEMGIEESKLHEFEQVMEDNIAIQNRILIALERQ